MIKVYALTGGKAIHLQVGTLTVVGGGKGTGVIIPELKAKDDYAIISVQKDGVMVHSLKGGAKTTLRAGETIAIQDLQLLVLDAQVTAGPSSESQIAARLSGLLSRFSEREELSSAMTEIMQLLLNRFHFERGLVIQKGLDGNFAVTCELGVETSQPWLSETLLQATLKSRKPVFVGNIVTSEFAANRSLLATGFTSICAWPLVIRGDVIGALVAGSSLPHTGLSEAEQSEAALMAHAASLFLSFHLRDLKLKEQVQLLRTKLKQDDLPLTTVNPELIRTCQLAANVADTPLSILIQGETGSGKEVMAHWLHSHSARHARPFVAINSGAIPGELLESMLFGHRKGAFTGAIQDQIGKFQQAQGGTIFLDEIGDIPEALQVKLLRALQERTIEPLGSTKSVSIDVRVIAASHKPLATLVHEGKFRADLYYRLAEVSLEIPPLRNRNEDIGLLALEFLKEFNSTLRLSDEAYAWIKEQAWLGNARELKSTIKRGALLARGPEIELADLRAGAPVFLGQEPAANSWLGGKDLDEARDRFVSAKIREALQRADGKRNRAADLLGIAPRTLFRYLEEIKDQSN